MFSKIRMSRKEELLKKFKYKRDKEFFPVTSEIIKMQEAGNNDYYHLCDSSNKEKDIYDGLKSEGRLPIYCKILENIENESRERLLGDISQDPVYSFLKNLEENIEEIAYRRIMSDYKKSKAESLEMYKNIDNPNEVCGGEDMDVRLNTKDEFIGCLTSCFEDRSSSLSSMVLDWIEESRITEERYNWIENNIINGSYDEGEFVDELPSYAWEIGFWINKI